MEENVINHIVEVDHKAQDRIRKLQAVKQSVIQEVEEEASDVLLSMHTKIDDEIESKKDEFLKELKSLESTEEASFKLKSSALKEKQTQEKENWVSSMFEACKKVLEVDHE